VKIEKECTQSQQEIATIIYMLRIYSEKKRSFIYDGCTIILSKIFNRKYNIRKKMIVDIVIASYHQLNIKHEIGMKILGSGNKPYCRYQNKHKYLQISLLGL